MGQKTIKLFCLAMMLLVFSISFNLQTVMAGEKSRDAKDTGEISLFAFNRVICDWMKCDGKLLYKYDELAPLFQIIGHLFGGSGDCFNLPDLRGKFLFSGEMPYYIAYKGKNTPDKAQRFLGEIALLRTDDSCRPEGWMPCSGGELNIEDHPGLFILIGARFGGNGENKFCVPDLSGKSPLENYGYYIYVGTDAIFPTSDFNEA